MPKTRRRRADQFWRDRIAAWQGSGQTVTTFCTTRRIGESTFFAKRRDLALRERSPGVPAAPAPSPSFAAGRVISDPIIKIVVPHLRHEPVADDR